MDVHEHNEAAEAERRERVLKEREQWEDPVIPLSGGYGVVVDGEVVEIKPNRNAALWRHAELVKRKEEA